MAASSGALLLLRRKFYIFCNLGQGQVSTSIRIHGVAKLSALRLVFRSPCCCYSSASSQSTTRHASTNEFPRRGDSVAFPILRRLRRFIFGAGACFGAVAFMCRKPWAIEGYGWKHAYLTMFARYELGIWLLTADVRISWRLLLKLLQVKSLSRRERLLLLHTATDVFITVPAAKHIVFPAFDLSFAVLPRLFPNILPPSTLEDKMKVQVLLPRLDFVMFIRDWLEIMCKYMGIPPLGTDEFLRFVLRERLEM